MPRIKPEPAPELTSFTEADEAMKGIGDHEKRIESFTAAHAVKVKALKAELAEKVDPVAAMMRELERDLKAFAEWDQTRKNLGDAKSWKGNFGTFGFRQSSKVVFRKGWNAAKVVETLKEMRLKRCIRIKEEPDKDAMKKLPADKLAEAGATLKTDDPFFYEIHAEAAAEKPDGSQAEAA